MKIKITQVHLICIILVQIIIIDALLIASFVKVIYNKSNSGKVAVVAKSQKNKVTPVPKKVEGVLHEPTRPPTSVPKKVEVVLNASTQPSTSVPKKVEVVLNASTQPPTPIPKKIEVVLNASTLPPTPAPRNLVIKLPVLKEMPSPTMGLEKDISVEQVALKNFVRKANISNGVLQELMSITQLHNPTPEEMKDKNVNFKKGNFVATAYDLSYKCCGKYPSDPQYGITFSGKKATRGRTIAVDPNVIPLGSKVYLEFSKDFTYLNGWYVAEDTGDLVKGRIIDVFFGKSASSEMEKFGRRRVNVWWTEE